MLEASNFESKSAVRLPSSRSPLRYPKMYSAQERMSVAVVTLRCPSEIRLLHFARDLWHCYFVRRGLLRLPGESQAY